MSTRWEGMHAGLRRSIDTPGSLLSFEELQERSPPLAPFRGPAAVAEFLVGRGNGLVGRDRVLRRLVEEASGGGAKRLALTLVLLGLWPALDSIFRKRRPLFQANAHDIEMEIIDRFIEQVQRINLARVSCLAATLVRNTEREVVVARLRERARAGKSDAVTPDAIAGPPIEDQPPFSSRFGLDADQSDRDDVVALRRWLLSAVGRDADLIVDAVIHCKSRLDLAAALGISHAASRKRLQRALDRARRALLTQAASQPAARSAWVSA